jgi:hypothetical protein
VGAAYQHRIKTVDRMRSILFALLLLAAVVWERPILAEEAPVPVSRQAELLVRVAGYDRNLPARAGGKARVLILVKSDDADSRAVAAAMENALRRFDKIGGIPDEVSTATFTSGAQVAASCRQNRISIVYVAPGLDESVAELAHALDGVDVLTAAAIPRFVTDGVVLGFDLVSGKPTLIINLPQAKRQNVAVDPKVVQLMRVIK